MIVGGCLIQAKTNLLFKQYSIALTNALEGLKTGKTSSRIKENFYGPVGKLCDEYNHTIRDVEADRSELEYRLANFSTIADLSVKLLSSFDLSRIIEVILGSIVDRLGFERVLLLFINREQGILTDGVTIGMLKSMVENIEINIDEDNGILTEVVKEKVPVIVKDAMNDPRVSKREKILLQSKNFLVVPMISGDEAIGVLVVDRKNSNAAIVKDDIEKIMLFIKQASLSIENARRFKSRITDSTTDLFTYNYFTQQLYTEIRRAERYGTTLSLIMIGIDNQEHLHSKYQADQLEKIMKILSPHIQDDVRYFDTAARVGQMDVGISLPETNSLDASVISERLRNKIRRKKILLDGHDPLELSLSIGVAEYPSEAFSMDDLINKATEAMREAAASGGDQYCVYSQVAGVSTEKSDEAEK